MHTLKSIAFLLLATVSTFGLAQSSTSSKLHPWQAPPPRVAAEAYFTNLKDGDRIETPYLLKFGLSGGWGLAPIANKGSERSGHHHLLVNRDLPLNFKEALPFNDQYIHFGKGQMETVLTLAPGTYTLRMLLADQNHLPHFVYSKPATITVTKKNDTDPKTLVVPGISLQLPQTVVKSPAPLHVQFHASGFNVAQRAQRLADSGHFRLTVTPGSGAPAVMDFVNGQTEVWLAPPAGSYSLKLELLDNTDPSKQKTAPASASVRVE
ncbi:DUF4399 domain-containing protein [Hydrogenophaga sp. BPS33]|uniref:DUF4399 domain-containing protein n=1 Tax=Hydrogenophaga sp. BPS33 TaxID=2651974 RepID=UPI00132021EC|nr:DUF4399 domain-containing protein [Hydrogenophaga sp. BPS33]QHE85024.1 DUF4399 domain-containing protein [Hydrogenophaga sp. BPS33]